MEFIYNLHCSLANLFDASFRVLTVHTFNIFHLYFAVFSYSEQVVFTAEPNYIQNTLQYNGWSLS